MPEKSKLLSDDTGVSGSAISWCRTLIGALNFLARSVRRAIAHTMSRMSKSMAKSTAGTVLTLEHLCGYLNNTAGFRVAGKRVTWADNYSVKKKITPLRARASQPDTDFHNTRL